MKVLITGAHGQLGFELQQTCPQGWELDTSDIDDLDITDAAAVGSRLDRFEPDLILNAAAYTAVDRAETEAELARKINVDGPENLARAAAKRGVRLIHLSTDFVFDGDRGRPYQPDDPPHPLGVYGTTKLEGEIRVRAAAAPPPLIVRTAWLYSVHGGNFVKTMLRLMATRDEVHVVADQVSTPTWARGLAEGLWAFARRPDLHGRFHWTDAGTASWYDFAVAIQEEGLQLGLLDRSVPVHPVPTCAYPTPARRPAYSVLDKTSTWEALAWVPVHWRVALREMLRQWARSASP